MKTLRSSVILKLLAGFIAVFCVSASVAVAASNGTYKGKTDSEYPVKVKVKKNKVTLFDSSVYASCGLSNFGIKFVFPPAGKKGATAKIKGNGTFKVVFQGSMNVSYNDDKRTLTGKFKGGRVSGSMKVEGLCSADSTYTAKK